MTSYPPELIARFRRLGLEKVARIEAIWAAVRRGAASDEEAQAALGDLHTLKGDARVIHFDEVMELCHALEGVFSAGARRRASASEELDFTVQTAIRALVSQLREPGDAAPLSAAPERLPEAARVRLAAAATAVFFESVVATGGARERLRGAWIELERRSELGATVGARALLARHEAATLELARAQNKPLELSFDIEDEGVGEGAAEALDVALLHGLCNAVDHGIEPPDVRIAAGKPRIASIRVRGLRLDDAFELSIEDDGRGVDWGAVGQRAAQMGLMSEASARGASASDLAELLFHPELSTRDEPSGLSGRGIGLSAIRAAAQRAGGGSEKVEIAPRSGGGTRLTVQIPAPRRVIEVLCFKARGADLLIALPARFLVVAEPLERALFIDPIEALGLVAAAARPSMGTIEGSVLNLRGEVEFQIAAGGEPRRAAATRACVTAEDQPAEIVRIDGLEAALLRPARLLETRALPVGH